MQALRLSFLDYALSMALRLLILGTFLGPTNGIFMIDFYPDKFAFFVKSDFFFHKKSSSYQSII